MSEMEYRFPMDEREMREGYKEALEACMERDRRIVAMDADLMTPLGIAKLRERFPKQVFNCGIQEANMVSMAAGMAKEGFYPFVHSFGAFASRRACDQIYISCAYAGNPMCVIGSDPGVASELNGGTHAANEDIALMRACPTTTVLEPSDRQMLRSLIPQVTQLPAPVYLRLFRRLRPRIYDGGESFQIGKARQLTEGNDAAVIACGIEVFEALKAAERLKREGILVRILDMFTIKPLDREAVIKAAKETGAVVTAENHSIAGGLGSAVAETLGEAHPVPLERVGIRDEFGQVGPMDWLMERYGLTADHIAEKVKEVLLRKQQR